MKITVVLLMLAMFSIVVFFAFSSDPPANNPYNRVEQRYRAFNQSDSWKQAKDKEANLSSAAWTRAVDLGGGTFRWSARSDGQNTSASLKGHYSIFAKPPNGTAAEMQYSTAGGFFNGTFRDYAGPINIDLPMQNYDARREGERIRASAVISAVYTSESDMAPARFMTLSRIPW